MAGFRVVRRPNPALADPMTQAEQSGHIRRLGKANGKPIYKIISPEGESLRGEIYRAGGHVTGGNPQKGAFAKPKILDPLRPSQPPSRPPLPAWKAPDTLSRLNSEWKEPSQPDPFGQAPEMPTLAPIQNPGYAAPQSFGDPSTQFAPANNFFQPEPPGTPSIGQLPNHLPPLRRNPGLSIPPGFLRTRPTIQNPPGTQRPTPSIGPRPSPSIQPPPRSLWDRLARMNSSFRNPDTDHDDQADATDPLAGDIEDNDLLDPLADDLGADDGPLPDAEVAAQVDATMPPPTPPTNRTGPAIPQQPSDLSNLFLQMLTNQGAQLAHGPDQVPMQQFQGADIADANRLDWYRKNVRMDPGIQARIMNSFGPGAARLQDMLGSGAQQRANAEHGRGVDALSAMLRGIPTAHNMAQETAHTSQQGRGPQSMEQLLATAVQSGNQEEVDRILGLEQQRAAGKRAPAAAPSAERELRDKIASGKGTPEDIQRLQQVQGKDTGKEDRERRDNERRIMDLEDALDEMDPDDPAYRATKDFIEGLRHGMTEAQATARADKKQAARGKAHGATSKAAGKAQSRLATLQANDPNDLTNPNHPNFPGFNAAPSAAALKDQLDKAASLGILDRLAEDLDAEIETALDARPSDENGRPMGTRPRIKNHEELIQQLRNKIVTDWQNANPDKMQEPGTAGLFGNFSSPNSPSGVQTWWDRNAEPGPDNWLAKILRRKW